MCLFLRSTACVQTELESESFLESCTTHRGRDTGVHCELQEERLAMFNDLQESEAVLELLDFIGNRCLVYGAACSPASVLPPGSKFGLTLFLYASNTLSSLLYRLDNGYNYI